MPGAGDAARGAGQHSARRHADGLGNGGNTAMGKNDQYRSAIAGRFEGLFELGKITCQHRRYIGVYDRGRDPLVFLDLRQDFRGQADVNLGQRLGQGNPGGFLVPAIAVGMQVTDRDRGHFFPLQHADGFVQRGAIKRYGDLAIGLDAFLNAKT